MKHAVGAVAVLAALAASPAVADGPDLAYRPHAPSYQRAYRSAAWHRRSTYPRHGYRRAAYGYREPGSDIGSYGPPPAYGQPAYGFVSGPAEYTEAYIGRGLIYNTPPEPGGSSYSVISSRY